MSNGNIFNIQKFSVHDGPGIRTTIFFKGCPLNCLWCHNPESKNYNNELLFNYSKCTNCGMCIKHCEKSAIYFKNNKIENNKSKCTVCGDCIDYCVNNAREIAGKEYSISEIMKEIEKDIPFYEQSGGGVTLSGGESLTQIDFVEELVNECNIRGISVVIDTCGHVPYDNFKKLVNKTQIFLYDIKHMDSNLHKKYAGVPNNLILENLKLLSKDGGNINIRIPLIEGINSDDENINNIISYLKNINVMKINLLPYHDIGKDKYKKLNLNYNEELMSAPSEERLNHIKKMFEKNNYSVKIGG